MPAEVVRNEILQFLAQDGASRRPQNKPLTHFLVDVEQLQILPELSMIPLFGFLETVQCCLERLLRWFNQTVDANQLFPVLISSPVSG